MISSRFCQLIILTIVYQVYQFDICSIMGNDAVDFRFVSFDETLRNEQIYQDNDDHFDAIVIDPRRDQIIVGARNSILRLSLGTFQLLEKFQWESSINDISACRTHLQSTDQCDNYVRVLALRSNDQLLLMCGTNAYRPICTWRRPESLSTAIETETLFSGDGKSPYNRQSPSVYHLIDTGELYSATSNEPIQGLVDPLMQRSFTQGKQLRTQQHDSNWLRNPHFVRIIDIGSYVYTFFREIALEHLSCGTNVYSRVARVCKHDDGTMKFSDTFRSFSKLRFLCSKKLSNEISSFEYNELQSIFFDETNKLIYGAFNLPKSGLSGSAICIYTVEQLERTFTSSFLTQKSNESYWLPSNVKQETEVCDSNQSNERPLPSGPVLRSGVLQSTLEALTLDNIRIEHLLVDQFFETTILFLIVNDGSALRKYSVLNQHGLCLIEHLELKPNDVSIQHWKVNQIRMIPETKELVITTSKSILKVPPARCHRFNTSQLCLAAMDPYCVWNDNQQQCVLNVRTASTLSSPVRRSLSCPILNATIDGGWTSWTSWFSCEQLTGETCLCRTRSCTQPMPRHGGRTCHGATVEINQCQVHGGWSSWSEWSTCSQTCGKSYRSRTRTCSNPEPKNNGRLCIGSDREEEACPEILCSGQSSRLSSWTEWSVCSATCGTGIQKRRRTCLINNNQCSECLEETRSCNQNLCPTQQATLWTDWTPIINPTVDGLITEKRTRFICIVDPSSNHSFPQIKSEKTVFRICNDRQGTDCRETDSVNQDKDDDWSPWSVWSDCYPGCGIAGSIETRRRTCMGQNCPGKDVEKRSCQLCSSESNKNWSCWTDWSECSPCGPTRPRSIKFRTRTCLGNSCQGESREERLCSSCSLGSQSFFLMDSINQNHFTWLHLTLVSIISFLFGSLSMLCLLVACRRFRRRYYRSRHRQVSNTFLHNDDRDYFQASTSNSSSSPRTNQDSDTFTTLSTTNNHSTKFRSFDSSSSSTNGGPSSTVSSYLKDIPSRKLNMYINPREMPPLPPAATLKRTSMMSSMKTNLDADDL